MIRILSILLCLTLLSSNIKAQQLTDRQALCLKGQVKRVTYSDGNSIAFNQKGKVISVKNKKGKYAKKIVHNKQGLISVALFDDQYYRWEFKYQNGKLTSIDMNYLYWDESYTYSDFAQGLPWLIKYESSGEGITSTVKAKVQYGDQDSHGNWCWRRMVGDMVETNESEETRRTLDYDESITRQIFYW